MKLNKLSTLYDNAVEMIQKEMPIKGTNSRRTLFSTNSRIGNKIPVEEVESNAGPHIPPHVRQDLGFPKSN